MPSPPPPLRILISGASIAGPSTAYWLSRLGPQTHTTILERFPSPRPSGQNIDIRPPAVALMRQKIPGMESLVLSKRYEISTLTLLDPSGNFPVAEIHPSGNPEQQTLVSEYEILRGDLSEILVDLSLEGEKKSGRGSRRRGKVEYVFDEQIVSLSEIESTQKLRVTFLKGRETEDFDLVVSAEGSTSRTRALGLGCGKREYVEATGCWAAFFRVKGLDLTDGKKGEGVGWTGPGGRFLAGDYLGKVVFMSIRPKHSKEGKDGIEGFRRAMEGGEEEVKRLVARELEGAEWGKAEEAVKGLMEAEDGEFYASEMVQVKVPRLSKGRFALVGDAGYATAFTGTGTSLAMVGAYVLAGEIGKHPGDVLAGLRGYEEKMRPIIEDMQRIPPGMPGLMAPQTAWGIWLRNLLLSFIVWVSGLKILAPVLSLAGSLFSSSTGKDKYNLPEYEWCD